MAAFSIEGGSKPTSSSIGQLYNFLSDFKNFESILPADKVENFQYSGDQCSFNIRGITALTIRITDKKPNEFILFSSEGLSKFNFQLKASFQGEASSTGTCQVDLYGDLNPFIKAMAEKPLKSLVDTMTLKLSELKL